MVPPLHVRLVHAVGRFARALLAIWFCPHREEATERRNGKVGKRCIRCLRFRELPVELTRASGVQLRIRREIRRREKAKRRAQQTPAVLEFSSTRKEVQRAS